MPEVTITRSESIVVGSVEKNSYGDLVFTDKGGGSHKISAKRVSFFEKVILKGRGVKLNYAMSSFGKEYIYNASLVEPGESRPIPQDSVPPELKPSGMKTPVQIKPDGKNRSYALAYAKDWAIALLNSPNFSKKETLSAQSIIQTAKAFENYLDTGEVPDSALVKEAKKLGAEEIKE